MLNQTDEKYGYTVIDSRRCVRVFFVLFFLFMTYICHFILHLWHIVHLVFSVNGMMILVLAYKNGFKSKSEYYGL